MSNCINLVVTKETSKEEIVHFLLTESQHHTFTIGGEVWTFTNTFEGMGYIVDCDPKGLRDWYYDNGLNRMKSMFDENDETLVMIGSPWHTYSELSEAIVDYVQTN